MSSPTQRTLALLKKEGWIAGIVERWIARAFKRIDLFGIIDILAMKEDKLVGIQTTSGSNVSAHITKALAESRLEQWLKTNNGFEIWGWRKVGKKGKRKLWQVRRIGFRIVDSGVVRDVYEE